MLWGNPEAFPQAATRQRVVGRKRANNADLSLKPGFPSAANPVEFNCAVDPEPPISYAEAQPGVMSRFKPRRVPMKASLLIGAVLVAGLVTASARDLEIATVVSMKSVPCGTQRQRHSKTSSLLCQEYVLQTDSMEYHIQQKQAKKASLLKLNRPCKFWMDKSVMHVEGATLSGKTEKLQFDVVSMNARDTATAPATQ